MGVPQGIVAGARPLRCSRGNVREAAQEPELCSRSLQLVNSCTQFWSLRRAVLAWRRQALQCGRPPCAPMRGCSKAGRDPARRVGVLRAGPLLRLGNVNVQSEHERLRAALACAVHVLSRPRAVRDVGRRVCRSTGGEYAFCHRSCTRRPCRSPGACLLPPGSDRSLAVVVPCRALPAMHVCDGDGGAAVAGSAA